MISFIPDVDEILFSSFAGISFENLHLRVNIGFPNGSCQEFPSCIDAVSILGTVEAISCQGKGNNSLCKNLSLETYSNVQTDDLLQVIVPHLGCHCLLCNCRIRNL